jgi:hypothetical protein
MRGYIAEDDIVYDNKNMIEFEYVINIKRCINFGDFGSFGDFLCRLQR